MLTDLITRGGPVMYLLLACSLVSVAIVLERTWFWFIELGRVPKGKLFSLLMGDADAEDSSYKARPFLNKVALLKKSGDFIEVARLVRKESERAYERSIKQLSGLDTIISIAPLLGILGTVVGIMKSFHALDLQHMTSPGEVGHGLAEAMITTATGLAIAVPTLVFYNLFHSIAVRHASTLYKLSEDIEQAPSKIQKADSSAEPKL